MVKYIAHDTCAKNRMGTHTYTQRIHRLSKLQQAYMYILKTSHPHMASNRAAKNVMDNICINNAVSLFISNGLGKILSNNKEKERIN